MYIIFEGPDGSGKSTIINAVADRLTAASKTSLVIRQPGTTIAGEEIRKILKGPIQLDPLTRQALHLADTVELVKNVPQLKQQYDYLLQDRTSFISSPIYATAEMGQCPYHIDWYKHASGHMADHVFIILSKAAEERAKQRAEQDHFDRQGTDFHKKVYDNYVSLAKFEQPELLKLICDLRDVHVIYNDCPVDETVAKIMAILTA